MKKKPFVTLEKLQEILKEYPTPFHIYDEKGIRENAAALKKAFLWNKGFKEFFAVKATPNPYLISILKEYGCGCDCGRGICDGYGTPYGAFTGGCGTDNTACDRTHGHRGGKYKNHSDKINVKHLPRR